MKVIFEDIMPFNLEMIAESGQAFRWDIEDDGTVTGIVKNFVIKAKQIEDKLKIDFNGGSEDIDFIKNYFGLDKNYKKIEQNLAKRKELLPAIEFCSGNRILCQDPWETTISFIISANNNIRNIKNTINLMCKNYGKPIKYKKQIFYTFPSCKVLKEISQDELKEKTRCGYRAKYIINTSKMIADGKVNLYNLKNLSTDKAREKLLTLPGVGPKVADCILLYSLDKYDAFPVDVWIRRAMENIYFEGKKITNKKIREFAQTEFEDKAGFVQQYLFYYSRSFFN